MNSDFIYGRNSVIEYLNTGKSINKAYLQIGVGGSINTIIAKLKDRNIQIEFRDKKGLDKLLSNINHQGIIINVPPYEYAELEDIFDLAKKRNEEPFIVILDGIEDQHNLGAIIRTVNIVGAHGVIIMKRRSADVTSIVNKISSGALNYTPVVRVTNLNSTIKELKNRGVWIISSDFDGDNIYNSDLTGSVALVIGSEGKGVSRLVKMNSDMVVKIPMFGEVNSLNASVACGVLVYEIRRQRIIRGGYVK